MAEIEETKAAPIVLRGRLTETDVADLTRCHDRVLIRPSIRWLACGFAAALATLAIWGLYRNGPDVFLIVVLVGCVYLLVVRPFERAWMVRRHYRRWAARYLETEVQLTADRLMMANDTHRSDLTWPLVRPVADSPAGVLFCNQAWQPLLWLPARIFQGNSLRACILDLAAGNGVEVRHV